MLVVADASPLIVLINIEYIEVLPRLFQRVHVPPQVVAELRQPNRPAAVLQFATTLPTWLVEQTPSSLLPISNLDLGELAAISLAEEIGADLILIDELKGRRVAADRKLTLTGTIGVLEVAASNGMLDLSIAFERIKKTDFWISHELLDKRLALFRSTKGSE